VAGLWALAVALPLLQLVGSSPEFFVAHRASGMDIVLLTALLVAAMPALAVSAIEIAGWAGPRVRLWAIDLVVGALVGVLAAQLAVHAGIGLWYIALAVAAGASLVVVAASHRWPSVGSFLALLSVAALITPLLFLSKPGIRTLLAGTPAAGPAGRADRAAAALPATPVVLVVFDELPLVSLLDEDRHIDAALYPHIAALAADGVWYRNATTVADFTRYALPALLSGMYPDRTALPTASDYPDTLFTMFAGTHRLEVVEAVTALCPPTLCSAGSSSIAGRMLAMGRDLRVVFLHLVLTGDLAGGLPDLTANWANFGDDMSGATDGDDDDGGASQGPDVAGEVRARWRQGIVAARVEPVRQFIDGISADDPQPTLYFLHSLISHQPHRMLPTGKENLTWHRLPGRRGWNRDHPWTVGQEYQRHLLQVGFVDRLVGELTGRLKSTGLYDRTLLIVTSDHGISYLPKSPQRDLTGPTAAEIMRVPLIIKFPGGRVVRGVVRDDNVESIDIVPTIADVLGVTPRGRVDGTSLIDPARPPREGKQMFAGEQRRARRYPAAGPDESPAVERKHVLIGDTSRNPHAAPRIPEFDALIGQPLSALRVAAGDGGVEVADYAAFRDVAPDRPAVVFDVSGRFATPQPDAVVAVAVNGVVEAVTRTWEANPRGFLATPGFGVWRSGVNTVEVFLVERDAGGLLLRESKHQNVWPADLNLVTAGARDIWGVRPDGFHPAERAADGTEFRWTRAHSILSHLSPAERPRHLEVVVLHVPGDAPKPLTIDANGCVLFEGQVQSGWTRSLSLDACEVGQADLTLGFRTRAERSGNDARRRGVALSRVVLR